MENLGDKQWYVVNTYSGHERNVADYLEKRRDSMMLQDYVFRIVVAGRPGVPLPYRRSR